MSTQVHQRVAGRVGATLTLMGVVAVSVLATLLGLSTDSNKTVTKQMPPAPVRIVDAPDTKVVNAPRTVVDGVTASKGCAEQTWPYIEARCLNSCDNSAN